MAIGIGIGLPFRRIGAKNYPTQNLQGRYVQLIEGADLINTRGGVSIPYISGAGLDQIFDLSVLNDDRFDKGSYVGNAYGLPEYYNYPYVGIYYDDTSETTRHYWKLTDFHYANILAQTVDTDIQNNYFLKALATTDTSNTITSISELLIYSVAQTGAALTQLKTYIGIQADFYGNNVIVNGDFSNGSTNWTLQSSWQVISGKACYDGINNGQYALQSGIANLTDTYGIWLDISSFVGTGIYNIQTGATSHFYTQDRSVFFEDKFTTAANFLVRGYTGMTFCFDNVVVKKKYIDYYKS